MNYLLQQAEMEEMRRVAFHRLAKIVVIAVTAGLALGVCLGRAL